MSFHSKRIEEIYNLLESNENGLSNKDVVIKRQKYGMNELPKARPKTILSVFLSQLKDLIVIILIITAIISFGIGEEIDGFFIILVILCDAILGTFQEWRAEKSAKARGGHGVFLQRRPRVRVLPLPDGREGRAHHEDL